MFLILCISIALERVKVVSSVTHAVIKRAEKEKFTPVKFTFFYDIELSSY